MALDPLRHIKLTPYTPARTVFRNRDCYRVKVVASNENHMPKEIFGYQRTLLDPEQGTTCDEFSFICSPYDLTIYPKNSPDPAQFPQYFRKDTFDIYVPGIGEAAEVLADVEAQVCHLVSLLNKLDKLVALPVIWCPSEPAPATDHSSDTSIL